MRFSGVEKLRIRWDDKFQNKTVCLPKKHEKLRIQVGGKTERIKTFMLAEKRDGSRKWDTLLFDCDIHTNCVGVRCCYPLAYLSVLYVFHKKYLLRFDSYITTKELTIYGRKYLTTFSCSETRNNHIASSLFTTDCNHLYWIIRCWVQISDIDAPSFPRYIDYLLRITDYFPIRNMRFLRIERNE